MLVGCTLPARLVAWFAPALDYNLSLERMPVVSADWQVQNGLSLRIGDDLL